MDKNRRALIAFVVAVVGFVIIIAIAVVASSDDDLDGTSWVVESVETDGEIVLPIDGTTVTAEFADDQVNGSAGCNTYFGGYETDGSSLSIGQLASTQAFCAEPDGTMDQEFGYLALLSSMARHCFDLYCWEPSTRT